MKHYQITLDHLEIFLLNDKIFRNFKPISDINETNTNLAYCDYTTEDGEIIEFKYSIVTPSNYSKGYTFSTIVNNKIIDAFNVAYGSQEGVIKSSHKLTIYASFIVSYGPDFIYKFINDFFDTSNFNGVRRFDLALDLPENKANFIKSLKVPATSQLEWDNKKGEFETIYFGNRKNKTFFLRCYDKVKDTLKKGKSFLYDFGDATDVTRLELEFGPQFCKKTNSTDENPLTYEMLLLDKKGIRDLFFSKIQKYTNYFYTEQFLDNYRIKNPEPAVKNLKDFYLNYNALPNSQVKRIKSNIKYIEILGLYGFLSLIFEKLEDKQLAEIYQRFYDKIKGRLRVKERFDTQELLKYKEFFDDVFDYIFAPKSIYSDKIFIEIEKTFKRNLQRNEKNLKNDLINDLKKSFEKYRSNKIKNAKNELLFDLETTFDMFKNKHNL